MNIKVSLDFPTSVIQKAVFFGAAKDYFEDELFSVAIVGAQVDKDSRIVKAKITGISETVCSYLKDLKVQGVSITKIHNKPRR